MKTRIQALRSTLSLTQLSTLWQRLQNYLGSPGSGLPNKAPHGMPSGKTAEALAEAFLLKQGVRILARNVNYRGGELDLIGYHRHTILFIEVRLRTHSGYGGAAQSITPTKQKRIILAARQWLNGAGHHYANKACRFDAILLSDLSSHQMEWIQSAFELPSR